MKKRKLFSKVVSAILVCAMLISTFGGSLVFAEDVTEKELIESVVVNTTVRPAGQYPDSITVTVADAAALEGLKAEDFSIAGQATEWLSTKLHDFTATVSTVSVEENVLTLTIGEWGIPEKYVYVDNYTVTCSANEELTFKCDKNTKVVTPIADEFEQIREEANGGMDYNLYTPEDTSKPQPIVIVFHGYGDNDNLYQNKLAVAWADPANQAERPCYVLAPSFTNFMNTGYRTGLYEKVYAEVQEMVEAGKVDPNRIYVVGKSFGGAAVYEFLETYPDAVAGAIAMCGAANYYGGYLFPQGEDDVAKIVDIPLWIAHATTDGTVGVDSSRGMYKMLTAAGSEVVKFTEYSDAEMTAAGVTAEMGNHSMEAVVLEDETYLEWLFAQNNSEVESVVVNTSVRPTGHCLESLEVTVSDADLLEGLTAEDFTLNGNALAWLTPSHPFTATVSDISVEGNVLTLTITDFTEKYFYVEDFVVTCSADSRLSFTSDMISEVITPIADEFEQIRGDFNYNLYTPEDTSKAQPIVIVFHGFLDDDNLYQNKLAVAWADPANQAERPCYVMAPLMGGFGYVDAGSRNAIYENVYNTIQQMVKEGKVDPKRIYVIGKSFGGAAVYEFLEKYPDDVAAAIAMCGAMQSFAGVEENLDKLVDIPLWIAHAENDDTVAFENSQIAYDTLVKAGSKVVKLTKYSDAEMNAVGVDGVKVGYHTVEMAVLEDEAYMEWLFAQPVVEDNKPVTNPSVPDVSTGDASPIMMWSAMLVLAMAVVVLRKKYQK